MIIIKDDTVKFKVFTPALIQMLYIVSKYHYGEAYKKLQPKDLVITSVNDGKHATNSRHYKNEAFDMRSHNFENSNKEAYRNSIEMELNLSCKNEDKFTVILENIGTPNEHFHFQVKKGKSFP